MAFSMSISSTLSLEKDADIISFVSRQNELGIKNSTLIKKALRSYMQSVDDIPAKDNKIEEIHQEINNKINGNSNNTEDKTKEEINESPSSYIRENKKLTNKFEF